ncbi:MAG: Type II secretion system protein G precursor [bacterium ADurb.Bin400]|nr:MAG: Type II secretion system protein G precursor [bacterium ADurb.Bin400]
MMVLLENVIAVAPGPVFQEKLCIIINLLLALKIPQVMAISLLELPSGTMNHLSIIRLGMLSKSNYFPTMPLSHQNQKAFTLIELVIILAIVGVLAAVILTNYSSAKNRSRYAKASADMEQISKAVRMFATERARYPSDVGPNAAPPQFSEYFQGWVAKTPCGGWTYDYENWHTVATGPRPGSSLAWVSGVFINYRDTAGRERYHNCITGDCTHNSAPNGAPVYYLPNMTTKEISCN